MRDLNLKFDQPRSVGNVGIGSSPISWLGQSVDTSCICSGYPELSQMPFLTSLGCAIRRPSLKKTHLNSQLRTKLGVTGPLMVDSGGFVLMSEPNANWTIRDVSKAIDSIDADIFVSLDFPPGKGDSAIDRRRKIVRSSEKFSVLATRFPDKIIMPVVHGRNITEIELAVDLLASEHRQIEWIGFGGVVPLLQNRRVSIEISSMGAEVFIAAGLQLIRKRYPQSKIHVFGAGGTRTFPAVFAFGADSADSIGWRQAAGFGSVFLPLKSQRAVKWDRAKGAPRKKLDESDLAQIEICGCPICRRSKSLGARLTKLQTHFHNRSIHNAWIISNQSKYWPSTRFEMHQLLASGGFGPFWAKAAENVPET